MKNLLRFLLTSSFFILVVSNISSQEQVEINYFNCTPPPADSAVVFARGIVSLTNRWEEKIGFTADGKEAFFGVHDPKDYFNPRIMHVKYKNGKWSKPDTASFSKGRKVGWPLISQDGKILFAEEVVGKTKTGVKGQVVFSRKTNGSWTAMEAIIPDVEAKEGFGLGQITLDSTFYFYDRYDRITYSSKVTNGNYSKPKALPYRINPAVEFFVSPKNDYIIFQPVIWVNQLHISFRIGPDDWSMPIPLSDYFKRQKWDAIGSGPYVSPDNKYFFFLKNGDIYWVKTDFIEALRKKYNY